ncbi:sulfite exporter TauE/SafE family protein [Deinococcus psychrotolerans]|uniref:sulfite exporter TauE/SafE family protein n=1 Tax=Deinococcus psychrotolerans TaxID=2489213 RepID=UPI0030B948A1
MLTVLGALLIGLSLGLLGSGGSILTVPVLVYLVGESGKTAIVESLAIVGLIALVGAAPHLKKRCIDGRAVLLFGGPGLLGTSLGTLLSHQMPAALQLLIFAAVMLIAAVRMFQPMSGPSSNEPRPWWQVALAGMGVGVLTGVVGVGGGFLILPALVLLLGLSMARAVGTSLVIIALNSALGFLLHTAGQNTTLHWPVIGLIAGIGILGSLLGSQLSGFFSPLMLRRSFAGFLVLLGSYILITSLPHALQGTAQHAAVVAPVSPSIPSTTVTLR